MVGRQTNLNLLNRCFEKLFEKILDYVTIKNNQEFKMIYQLIMIFLQNNRDYKWNKN